MYAQNGQEDEARYIAIAKQEHRIAAGDLNWPRRLWRRLLGVTIGHGYRPAQAGGWALAAIALLTALVWFCPEGLLTARAPASAQAPVPPSPTGGGWAALGYAVDVFVPVGDFKTADAWQANGWLEPVRLLFVALGWVLGTIFVAGFTRIVRS